MKPLRPLKNFQFICVGAVLAGALFAAAAVTPGRATAAAGKSISTLSSLDIGVLAQLNGIRVSHGLAPLTINAGLAAAAAQHSTEMIADGYFAHDSHDGSAFWKRLLRFYPQAGATRWAVGENLLQASGSITATQAMAAWMASPDHRANILSPTWHEIGISAVAGSDTSGADVLVITTDFGART
jgi:uncharacterized protein YkwD